MALVAVFPLFYFCWVSLANPVPIPGLQRLVLDTHCQLATVGRTPRPIDKSRAYLPVGRCDQQPGLT